MLFDHYLRRWNLVPDGEVIKTNSSYLLPVRMSGRLGGRPAMIKIALDAEEKLGARVLRWWNGEGAARVYQHEGDVLLMERAQGPGSLMQMALNGQDDDASRIICEVISRLHVPRPHPPASLITLAQSFESLSRAAPTGSGLLRDCHAIAQELLNGQQDSVVLHGDAHHDNILDFESRGWLAIDPKRVMGERTYDYVNVICNPELSTSINPDRFIRQSCVVAEAAGLDRRHLLLWIFAHAGLSASWFYEDDDVEGAEKELAVAKLARQELKKRVVIGSPN